MKLSEKWLREWVNPPIPREKLTHLLTMAGIGIESCEPFDDDFIFEFELTPNRSDCLSVLGIAREISVITNTPIHQDKNIYTPILDSHLNNNLNNSENSTITINNYSPEHCPRYTGRIIKNLINPNLNSPAYKSIQNKLTQSNLKLIHPIVDVMNYVMLELGQPLHAFDLKKINSEINIRLAKDQEKIILLDQKDLTLSQSDNILIIADKNNPIALAGIMGSLDSAVSENTQEIFIESAFFTPDIISSRARKFGLHTDASHRFERGVDPELPLIALHRATELLKIIYPDIKISNIINKTNQPHIPILPKINLKFSYLEKILGIKINPENIKNIFQQLHFTILEFNQNKNIIISPNSFRFDIQQEIDLIEEIARIYGYENIPAEINFKSIKSSQTTIRNNVKLNKINQFKSLLTHQNYQEIITYSFISEKDQHNLDPNIKPITLSNPLSSEYAVMRSNLWAGLLQTVQYHLNRQQNFLKFFEMGLRFYQDKQEPVLSAIWTGKAHPEQWGEPKRDVDFFDMKNNLEQLFSLTNQSNLFSFQHGNHPALHPAQTAEIFFNQTSIGYIGALHPELQQKYNIKLPVYLFEIILDHPVFSEMIIPTFKNFSKFPSVRRDIALFIQQDINSENLIKIIQSQAGNMLSDICVFDLYQDKKQNNMNNTKSIALGLTFQHVDRTLSETEIQDVMNKIIHQLKSQPGVSLRE